MAAAHMDVASKRRELEDTGVLREHGPANPSTTWESTLAGKKRARPHEDSHGDVVLPPDDIPSDPWRDDTGSSVGKLAQDEQDRPLHAHSSWQQQEEASPEAPVGEAHADPNLSGEGSSTHRHLAVSYGNRAVRARVGIG